MPDQPFNELEQVALTRLRIWVRRATRGYRRSSRNHRAVANQRVARGRPRRRDLWAIGAAESGVPPQDAAEVERLRQVLRAAIVLMDEITPPPWHRQERPDLGDVRESGLPVADAGFSMKEVKIDFDPVSPPREQFVVSPARGAETA